MGLPVAAKKGVFSLEGDWDPDLRHHYSVEPGLKVLNGAEGIPYIHRRVGTSAEFEYYLRKWTLKKYEAYPILYLSFHGGPECFWMPEDKARVNPVTLDRLSELLEGKCGGRIIHLGSCATLALHGAWLNQFIQRTGALAVCGYSAEVDWTISTAFEVILFYRMQRRAFNRMGAMRIHRDVDKLAKGLVQKLGFRMKVRPA
jgi:hypothetical protein